MKNIVESNFGTIIYDENFWTGKRRIAIGGVELSKIDKKTYSYKLEEREIYVNVKGNFLSGVQLEIDGQKVQVVEKTGALIYIIAILPIIFVCVWGNVPQSVEIFPVVGGAIGGGVSALISFGAVVIAKGMKQKWLRPLIALAGAVVAVLACWLIALLILG